MEILPGGSCALPRGNPRLDTSEAELLGRGNLRGGAGGEGGRGYLLCSSFRLKREWELVVLLHFSFLFPSFDISLSHSLSHFPYFSSWVHIFLLQKILFPLLSVILKIPTLKNTCDKLPETASCLRNRPAKTDPKAGNPSDRPNSAHCFSNLHDAGFVEVY